MAMRARGGRVKRTGSARQVRETEELPDKRGNSGSGSFEVRHAGMPHRIGA